MFYQLFRICYRLLITFPLAWPKNPKISVSKYSIIISLTTNLSKKCKTTNKNGRFLESRKYAVKTALISIMSITDGISLATFHENWSAFQMMENKSLYMFK